MNTAEKQELEIVEVEENNNQVSTVDNGKNMMQFAMQQGASIDQMKELMVMQERIDATEARKAFNLAMSKFAANAPTITKDAHVSFGNTNYKHATLGNVVSTIVKALSEQGLSHRWRTAQEGASITVTCVITHELGHSEETVLSSNADTSGSIKGIQAVASTITYLERYTLLAATGCATGEQDDDGMKAEDRLNITEGQAKTIEKLLKKAGNSDAFYRFYNIIETNALQQRDYPEAVKMLESKIKRLGVK